MQSRAMRAAVCRCMRMPRQLPEARPTSAGAFGAQVKMEKKNYEAMLQKAQAQQRPRAAAGPAADSGY